MSSDSDYVDLNVGGRRFTTTRSTLCRISDSMLARMFEEGSQFRLARDGQNAVLIDRDGSYFAPLLNYLRHGELVVDPGVNAAGVYEEAKYFGLDDCAAQLAPERRRAPARLPTLCAQLGNARSGGVKSLLPLDDGSLITGGVDGGCTLWRPAPPAEGDGGDGDGDGDVVEFEPRLERAQEFRGHQRDVNAIAIVASLRVLFTASHDHTVKVWEAPETTPPAARGEAPAPVSVPLPDAPPHDRSPQTAEVRVVGCRASLRSHSAEVSCLGVANGWLITGSYDKSLCFWPWGAQDAQPASRAIKPAHGGAVLSLAVCGPLVVSCALDSTVSAWEIETGAHVAKFSTEAPIVYSLLCATPTAAPASERGGAPVVLYSGDVNYIVKEWQLHQRDGRRWVEPAGHLAGHTDVINCMAAAARGAVLLSASSDGTVGVWDVESRTSVGALGGFPDKVYSVAASGRLVFTGCKDGLVRIFRFEEEVGVPR